MDKTTLTERFCETAKVTTKRLDYLDTKVPGLYFRVTPNGIKSWSLLYTDKRTGKKRRLHLGRYIGGQEDTRVERREGVTLAKARQLAKQHIADIGQGADPARAVTLRRDGLTFRELAAKKLESMKPNREGMPRRALNNYESMLRRHVDAEIGSLRAFEVEKADIARVLDKAKQAVDGRFIRSRDKAKRKSNPVLLKPGRKVSHQPNRVFEMMRSIFRYGVKNGLIDRNPMELMGPPVEVNGARDQHLSLSDIPGFWRSLDSAPISRQLALAMKVQIATGQRIGELIRRQKMDIDLTESVPVLLIPRADTKNKKKAVHRVPLSPLAMRLLNEAIAIDPESPFIFPSTVTGESLTPGAATRAMGRLRPQLAVADLRVHDLRRTASNGMRKLGVSKFIVSVVLNHVSATSGDVTSEHYLDEYAFETEKADALIKWGVKLEQLLAAPAVIEVPPE